MNKKIVHITLGLLAFIGCKQSYTPPAIAHPPDYLVVEGFLENNGSDSTVFTLSHTVNLDSNTFTPELGAKLIVEGSDNSSFPLNEMSNGKYGNLLTSLRSNLTWRLHIITAGGKQYASDYVPLVFDPPIDSINWVRSENPAHEGIQVYANTHDPQNNTHFYRWTYQECWEFHSPFESDYQYKPGQGIVIVSPADDFICWHYNTNSSIILGNSTQLAQDLIYEQPVVLVPLNSQQITVRYSVLVTQYALTEKAFSWWQILQKNTEQIGSIFGVMPAANTGNIHCLTDTSEQVLGYVSGGNTHAQRIFITNDQVQPWNYNSGCVEDTTRKFSFQDLWTMGDLPIYVEFNGPTHYSLRECVDCRYTGTITRPPFW